jgi:diguanylate cyclase (GGDEF)-like protein
MSKNNNDIATITQSLLNEPTSSQLLDSIPIALFILNNDHIITHWNLAITKASGLSKEQMIGTKNQWKPFYPEERPTMADLILDSAGPENINQFYTGKYHASDVLEDAFEAEDYFPDMGNGEWLSFTAAPIYDEEENIVGALETLVVISDRKKAEFELIHGREKYKELSIIDDLSQLFNARHLYDQLNIEIQRSHRYKQPLSICMFDIDNFKSLNDTHGHQIGNMVLESFGKLVKSSIRRTDSGYRYGGEEFIILMPSSNIEDSLIVVDRIRIIIEKINFESDSDEPISVTVSGGLATLLPNDDSDSILRRVDKAMYKAKNSGKNCIITVEK